ncbi:dTDP-4-dehydrorhamnose 3,5-epimerase [Rhodobacteraceae bacterium 2CG4]|uniref:dTDP-4-dehydrorhamnose 3,5-epimerase n=1 Tax=Halovulum marinum TaxID=2662447 RepID=A0A6L5Z575_9RHOB|nr:dTDP-4-dehydrorhamnose 3,5-epimerase [Halovulum marinum]MSU91728.1 dTDP-4-dehydrorhamnose 3,5-epimerase [Halovulum marinum]
MQIETTALDGVVILTPRRFGDERGFFSETWNARAMAEAGLALDFVQDNHAWTRDAGTVRGLHYQAPPSAQDKLVRVVRGRIMDVAVDVRKGSPTYGQWTGVELSAGTGRQLLVPRGFLHGYATLTPDCDVVYKCTDYYAPRTEGAVRFDDPDLGIDWGIGPGAAILSDKDAAAGRFADLDSPFRYGETA